MKQLDQHIEALIFAADQPITLGEIRSVLEATFEQPFQESILEKAVERVRERYAYDAYAMEIVHIGGGYQFLTKGAFFDVVAVYLKQKSKKRLSRSALETLSIVAYKQPVSKRELEKIRGVSCDYAIQKLLEKELVTITGRSDGPGRPLLYGTGEKFMDYFGLKDLSELPKPKDFKEPESQIGEQAPIEETDGAAGAA